MKKSNQELQAILQGLQQLPKGTEWIEFKEASQDFDFDRLGRSFSSLSNEANLHGEHTAWLVFGVNDKASVVGSQFRPHRAELDALKQEVATRTSHNHTFVEIYELHEAAGRVILFQIPPAPPGMPIAWNARCYGRDGDSLVALPGSEIEQIRWQQAGEDWSIQVVSNASLKDLDPAAIAQARASFKKRLQNPSAVAGVDDWDDTVFLDRAKLTVAGRITRTAILLLGRPESAALLSPALAQIAWRQDGEEKACAHFGPPFLLTVHDVFRRLRNGRFLLQPFGQSIPVELENYDPKVLREALCHCLMHHDYARPFPVLVTGLPDRLFFEFAGTFIQGAVADCVLAQQDPHPCRNPFLARAMVAFNMVDSMDGGLQRMFTEQRQRFFPLPDYDLSQPDRVRLVIHGKLLDENYSRLLLAYPALPLRLVMALDRVQKKLPIPDGDLATLRRFGLVEGRINNLWPATRLFALDGGKAEDVVYRQSDASHLKDIIRQLILQSGSASISELESGVRDCLPAALTEAQKHNRLKYVLGLMRDEGVVENLRVGQKVAVWKLKNPISTNFPSKAGDSR